MTITMHNPQAVILEELAEGGHTQRSIACTYGFILRQEFRTADWPLINKAILRRWPKGLARVKKMAWRYATGTMPEAKP